MQKLLEVIDNEPRVSHRVVAQNTNNNQKNINEMIRKYEADFMEFGQVPFKTEAVSETELKENPDRKAMKTYYLNEPQATFLMTLLRNSPVVVDFKKKLVKAFFELREVKEVPNSAPQVLAILENMSKIMLVQSETIASLQKTVSSLESTIEMLDANVRIMGNDAACGMYAVSEALYMVNLEDTLSTDMLDEIKANVKNRAQTLARQYAVSEAELTKLIFANINNNFGVKTYYKIKYSEFIEVKKFIKSIDLKGHKVVVSL